MHQTLSDLIEIPDLKLVTELDDADIAPGVNYIISRSPLSMSLTFIDSYRRAWGGGTVQEI